MLLLSLYCVSRSSIVLKKIARIFRSYVLKNSCLISYLLNLFNFPNQFSYCHIHLFETNLSPGVSLFGVRVQTQVWQTLRVPKRDSVRLWEVSAITRDGGFVFDWSIWSVSKEVCCLMVEVFYELLLLCAISLWLNLDAQSRPPRRKIRTLTLDVLMFCHVVNMSVLLVFTRRFWLNVTVDQYETKYNGVNVENAHYYVYENLWIMLFINVCVICMGDMPAYTLIMQIVLLSVSCC